MLTRGLQAAIAGRLAGDAWFSDPARGVAVVPQDRGDAAAVVRSSLARCGCGGEIEEVRLLPGRTRREFELRVTVRFGERPVAALEKWQDTLNKAAGEAKVPAPTKPLTVDDELPVEKAKKGKGLKAAENIATGPGQADALARIGGFRGDGGRTAAWQAAVRGRVESIDERLGRLIHDMSEEGIPRSG